MGGEAQLRGRGCIEERTAVDLVAAAVLDDELSIDDTLAACVQLSLSTPPPASPTVALSGLVVHAPGMNLHAATTVDGRDRRRLERVCKYLLRPRTCHEPSTPFTCSPTDESASTCLVGDVASS